MRFQVEGGAAEQYEQRLVPALFRTWVPLLLERAGVTPGMRVIDVACGTGVVARGAAEVVGPEGRVAGVDLNPEMLAVARRAGPSVEWREADACALPFGDDEFDVAFCQQGLQFVPDRVAALAEMGRVVVPGAPLVVAVWQARSAQPVFDRFVESLERHVGSEAADMMRSPFQLGEERDLRAAFAGAGLAMRTVEALSRSARFPSAAQLVEDEIVSTPLLQCFADVDEATVARVVDDVAAAVTPVTNGAGVELTLANHVVVAIAPG